MHTIKSICYFVLNKVFFLFCCLTHRKWDWFDSSYLDSKKIIVVGPASSSLNYMTGKEIDNFDVIVRINKSPLNLEGKTEKLGSRTDILYHCCDEDPITGGGKLDEILLKKQHNKFVLYTYNVDYLERKFYKSVIKYPEIRFSKIKKTFYDDLKRSYKARMPTTGLQALNHLLSCNFKELHITGFTFFQTNYTSGYRDGYSTAELASSLAKSSGNHDPEDELRLFIEIFERYKENKSIFLDRDLEEIVDKYKKSAILQ